MDQNWIQNKKYGTHTNISEIDHNTRLKMKQITCNKNTIKYEGKSWTTLVVSKLAQTKAFQCSPKSSNA